MCYRWSRALVAAAWLSASVAGCAGKSVLAPGMPGPASLAGRSTYELVPEPPRSTDSTADRSRTREHVIAPRPADDNVLPAYPETALAARHGPESVTLRVVIDVTGNVVQVTDSPLAPPAKPGAFAGLFRDSAAEAVGSWKFAPARRQYLASGTDGDSDGVLDYGRWESVAIPVYVDIRFTFEIVEGRGRVHTSPGSEN